MNKKFILAAALAATMGTAAYAGPKKEKVKIVKPNGQVISVAPEAVEAHLRNGSVLFEDEPPVDEPPTGNDDPYAGYGDGGDTTDPYAGGSGSGGTTDGYPAPAGY